MLCSRAGLSMSGLRARFLSEILLNFASLWIMYQSAHYQNSNILKYLLNKHESSVLDYWGSIFTQWGEIQAFCFSGNKGQTGSINSCFWEMGFNIHESQHSWGKNIIKERKSLKALGSPQHSRWNHQEPIWDALKFKFCQSQGGFLVAGGCQGEKNSPNPLGNALSSLNEMVVKSEYFKAHIFNGFYSAFYTFFWIFLVRFCGKGLIWHSVKIMGRSNTKPKGASMKPHLSELPTEF